MNSTSDNLNMGDSTIGGDVSASETADIAFDTADDVTAVTIPVAVAQGLDIIEDAVDGGVQVAAAGNALVEIVDDEVPLAAGDDLEIEAEDETSPVVQGNDEGTVLTEVEDEQVPLAIAKLDDHAKHCILHFVELLAALGLSGYYVGSTEKQKKEIKALKEEIGDGRGDK